MAFVEWHRVELCSFCLRVNICQSRGTTCSPLQVTQRVFDLHDCWWLSANANHQHCSVRACSMRRRSRQLAQVSAVKVIQLTLRQFGSCHHNPVVVDGEVRARTREASWGPTWEPSAVGRTRNVLVLCRPILTLRASSSIAGSAIHSILLSTSAITRSRAIKAGSLGQYEQGRDLRSSQWHRYFSA